MRRIDITLVKENDILAEDVFTLNGMCLLKKGSILTSNAIKRLSSMGFCKLCIEDKLFEGIDFQSQELINYQTKLKALNTTNDILKNYQKTGQIERINELKVIMDDILHDILNSQETCLDISEMQSYDIGTYTHSLSVTILSLYMAKNLNLTQEQLKQIGIGCLLHDVGKMNIPLDILNKPSKLTTEEFDIVKRHPYDGFVAIKDRIPLISAHIALQHHEKFDGTGYPRQIKGNEIHLYGRISAIADVYDAITADRPYRKGMTPNDAIELMMTNSGTHFDPELLQEFLKLIAAYPNGTIVELSNSKTGIVTNQNKSLPLRPQVLIFKEKNNYLKEFTPLNLSEELDVVITNIGVR